MSAEPYCFWICVGDMNTGGGGAWKKLLRAMVPPTWLMTWAPPALVNDISPTEPSLSCRRETVDGAGGGWELVAMVVPRIPIVPTGVVRVI